MTKKPLYSSILNSISFVLLSFFAVNCSLVKPLGKNLTGESLTRLQALPNYKNDEFKNLDEASDSASINGFSSIK